MIWRSRGVLLGFDDNGRLEVTCHTDGMGDLILSRFNGDGWDQATATVVPIGDDGEGRAEVKVCPFCGAVPDIEPWHGGEPTKHLVSCQNEDCWVQPGVSGPTKDEAIARWNQRPPTQ